MVTHVAVAGKGANMMIGVRKCLGMMHDCVAQINERHQGLEAGRQKRRLMLTPGRCC
jgi:hypothetical protein